MSTFISEFLLGGSGKRVAIKDSIDIAGHPTRSGSRAFAEAPAASNRLSTSAPIRPLPVR